MLLKYQIHLFRHLHTIFDIFNSVHITFLMIWTFRTNGVRREFIWIITNIFHHWWSMLSIPISRLFIIIFTLFGSLKTVKFPFNFPHYSISSKLLIILLFHIKRSLKRNRFFVLSRRSYTPITEIVVIWLNTNHSFLTSKSDFHKSFVAFHFTSIEFDYKSIKYQSMSQATSHKSEWVRSILFRKWLDTEIHNGLFFVMVKLFQQFLFIILLKTQFKETSSNKELQKEQRSLEIIL